MTKIPYGFDPSFRHLDDDPWINLRTIREFLYDGEPVPPDLASWLGEAIAHNDGDVDGLLRRLGLKKARGRPISKYSQDAWLVWGGEVCRLERDGFKTEQAIETVQSACGDEYGQIPSRAQVQAWRKKYLLVERNDANS